MMLWDSLPVVRLHHDRLGPQDPVSIEFDELHDIFGAMEIDPRSSLMLFSNMVTLSWVPPS